MEVPGLFSMILHVHIDESGKFKNTNVISLSALISQPDFVRDVSVKWFQLLNKHGIDFMHVSELMRWDGIYQSKKSKWGNNGRLAVIREFIELVRLFMTPRLGVGITVALDAKTWRSLTSEQQRRVGRPDLVAYEILVASMLSMGYQVFPPLFNLSLVCDDEEEIAFRVYRLWRRLRVTNAPLAKRIVSITFANDESYLALQLADLFSNTCYKEALRHADAPIQEVDPLFSLMKDGASFARVDLNKEWLEKIAAAEGKIEICFPLIDSEGDVKW